MVTFCYAKGVEGKIGKGKAPHGRGHGSTRDEDDGSPGGGPGQGDRRKHQKSQNPWHQLDQHIQHL